jgi:intracellular septation protein
MNNPRSAPSWLRPTVDYGPLGVFFAAYCVYDILAATGAMLAATIVALSLSLIITRRVPVTTLVTSAMMLVFGGLTLWLSDESYLKLQSTLINCGFSLILFAAVAFGWPVLRALFGPAMPMSDDGWRILSLRFALFFAGMAAANEAIARLLPTTLWVDWNVFGQTGATLGFLALQLPLLNRHLLPAPAKAARCAGRED